jgi:hypothetical protein
MYLSDNNMFCNDYCFIAFLYLFVKVTKSVCMMKEYEYLFITLII